MIRIFLVKILKFLHTLFHFNQDLKNLEIIISLIYLYKRGSSPANVIFCNPACFSLNINQAKCFSVFIVDETTDVSRVEQLSSCVRYLDNNLNIEQNKINNYVLKEHFLQFLPVNSTTGQVWPQ